MKIQRMAMLIAVITAAFLWTSFLNASESENCQPDRLIGKCKQLSEQEISSVKTSNDPNLMMGTGIISLVSASTSSIGRDLLESASRIESPKGVATITLLDYYLDPSRSLPLATFKYNIAQLLQDDKDNAQPYYLNGLLLGEEQANQKALDQIRKGNKHKFTGYSKQRFYAIAQVAKKNTCGIRQARELAFWNSNNGAFYLKLRYLCRDLKKELGQDAQDACMIMGKNLETSSLSCLESLFSLHIQSESLNQTTNDDAILAEIKKRRDVAFACGARTVDIQESDMTDEIDKQYYEIYFDKGEAAAQQFLQTLLIKK